MLTGVVGSFTLRLDYYSECSVSAYCSTFGGYSPDVDCVAEYLIWSNSVA